MFIIKIIENNTTYIYKNYIYLHCYQLFLLLQQFHYILPQVYQLIFFYTYKFYNPNTRQHPMIYHIHTHNHQASKYILYQLHLYQLILYIRIDIYHHSSAVYYQKHLHLIYIYSYMFHAILCLLFDQFLNWIEYFNIQVFLKHQEHTFLHMDH